MEGTVLGRIGYRFTTEGGDRIMLDIGSTLKALYLGINHKDLQGVGGGEHLALEFSLRDIQSSGKFANEATTLCEKDGFKVFP
jgi:hypothetical protein